MANIIHEVWIDAPIAKVYKAIASAEGVSTWWDQQTERRTEEGLIWEHSPGPEHGPVQMKVVELIESQKVEWVCVSKHKADSPASAWTGTHFLFELFKREQQQIANEDWATAIPAQTILVFQQKNYPEDSPYFGFNNFAWAQVLDQLKTVVEGDTKQ